MLLIHLYFKINLRKKILLSASFILLIQVGIVAQTENYSIVKSFLSSDKYDEFSPVYYKNGIVFTSNRNQNPLINYSDSLDKGLFKIYFIENDSNAKWQKSQPFSKFPESRFNDGPATFNSTGDTVYFSRNLEVKGKLKYMSGPRNKLGIFYSVLVEGKWSPASELRFNNEWYNNTTPYLSPDGKRLYFASDKSGGYGGSDLYYCQWINDYWDNPVNLGPVINTSGNEAYPFIDDSGGLYFASDGHPGLGGKDIFYSKLDDSNWKEPVHLNSPINSVYDDFGLVCDSVLSEGYFSSNRDKSIDIYKYKTNFHQFFYCENQETAQKCFQFIDDSGIDINPINMQYEWDFGNNEKASGLIVDHCFPLPGRYSIKQNIIDKKTRRILLTKLSYSLDLKPIEQAVITGDSIAVVGEKIKLTGKNFYIPGYNILSYNWDLGNGIKSQGEEITHVFTEKGKFQIRLGLILKKNNSNRIKEVCVSRKLNVFSNSTERDGYLKGSKIITPEFPEIIKYKHAIIDSMYSAKNELKNSAVFQVLIFQSKKRNNLTSNIFNNIESQYTVKEIFHPKENIYNYIIDEKINFMDANPALQVAIDKGFNDARIITFIHNDPAEKELNNIKRVYGMSTDTLFEKNDISLAGFPMLDQIALMMKKYPNIKLIVATHTDNKGTSENNLELSKERTSSITKYLTNMGINSSRLIPKYYGASQPIASNYTESERKRNRRVEFTIIKE